MRYGQHFKLQHKILIILGFKIWYSLIYKLANFYLSINMYYGLFKHPYILLSHNIRYPIRVQIKIYLIGDTKYNKRASLAAMVRLNHCDLEVTCLIDRNSLFTCRHKSAYVWTSLDLQWEPCALGHPFFPYPIKQGIQISNYQVLQHDPIKSIYYLGFVSLVN